MQCSWDMKPKPFTHIPKTCGRDAVVIYQGPRDHQVSPLCKDHAHCISHFDSDRWGWQKMTPDEYVVRRVMSE